MNELVAVFAAMLISFPVAIVLALLLFPHEDHPAPAEEIEQ